ncbi:hypothetical protein [Neopusillimonas aromaticivorans]|nr:hypothetical protein [Neopusillimonas aromaticivorans]WJJ94737.1 hypothetical protein N7E01_07505 [Neopusillimonas aromaticivorans]
MNGTVRYVFADDTVNGWVFFDRNADGTADEAVQLTGVTAVVAADFV